MVDVGSTKAGVWSRRDFLRAAAGTGAALVLTSPGALRASSSANELRIALVGLGAQGRVLMDAVLKIENVRFVAVCDIWDYALTYGERLLKKMDQEVRGYSDYREMLDKEKDLDAVLVATPDFWHAPITNDCLRAGLNVYCEKMMSNTIEGARSMVQTMRETGKLLQIGHQRRSNPRYIVALERLYKKGLLGRVTAANAQWNRAAAADLSWPKKATMSEELLHKWGYEDMNQFRNWRWFKKYGGGPLSDLGAHQIDIFNWFFDGPPVSVLAGGGNDYYPNHEWFDNAMVIYEYQTADGPARAFYQVLTTTSAGGGYFEQFMGIDGTLKISENPKLTALYREAHAPSWDEFVAQHLLRVPKAPPTSRFDEETKVDARETAALAAYELPVVLNKAIHQPHLENFFNAIRGEAKLNCPADEAFRSEYAVFKAIEAVYAEKMIRIDPEETIA